MHNSRLRWLIVSCALFAWLLTTQSSRAEVSRVEIASRQDVSKGQNFGAAGAYEALTGRAYFTLDPNHAKNADITDLKLAAHNANGQVEFSADVVILRPKNAAKANGVALFEVVNRGRRTMLSFFNEGTGPAIADEAAVGNGFLLQRGYTLVWLGWQQDLLPGDLMRLQGPVAPGVTGVVYGDVVVSKREVDVSLGDRGSAAYPVADPQSADNQLTVSASRNAVARQVPKNEWAYARVQDGKQIPDPTRLWVKGGFEPGAVYRFTYAAKDPQIAGLGFAGIRDLISWLRYDPTAQVHAAQAYAFGMSQSGRFLRQFLHEGFNADAAGRAVFDGMMIHIAGGASRGFNERFAQPSRTELSRVFPFSDVEQTDSNTGQRDGLLVRARKDGVVPKILYTSTSWEYWGSVASVIHTSIDGTQDIAIPDTSRVYLLAATQHVPVAFPPDYAPERGQLRLNPLNYRPVLRALLTSLDQWVKSGARPPNSAVPRIADKTLVSRERLNTRGYATINVPNAVQSYVDLDSGERAHGAPNLAAPRASKPYVALVPQVDDDGNDIAGIRLPELVAPLATYTGWSLRDPSLGAPTDLLQTSGSYLPLPRTRAQRQESKDARLAIEERYTSQAQYLGVVEQAARALVKQRFLREEDIAQITASAKAHWEYAASVRE
jgi:hypothetical protein